MLSGLSFKQDVWSVSKVDAIIIAMRLRGAVRSRRRKKRNMERKSSMPSHVEGILYG